MYRILLLIFPIFTHSFLLNTPPEYQPGYGYVGPACAVFDGTLFLHGVSKRKLSDHELYIFRTYQHDLSSFKDASESYDSFEESFPTIPKFCGGYDDAIEVVLDSCIVRNNHVYVGDHLIRPLTNFEKQKIQLVKMRRMYGESKKSRRIRRAMKNGPGTRPQRDFSEMIHKLLNINSTVTSRFLPVVSQSPLFAMEGPWQSLLELGRDKDVSDMITAAKYKPISAIDITKIDSPYRATFTTTVKPKVVKPKKKEMTTTTTTTTVPTTTPSTTVRQISIQTAAPVVTMKRKLVENTPNIQTVVDPIILKLISKALEKNELIDEVALKKALSMNLETSTMPTLPFRFVLPPSPPPTQYGSVRQVAGLSHNHLFIPHQPFTTLASTDSRYTSPNPLSHRLPNEICRVHATQHPF